MKMKQSIIRTLILLPLFTLVFPSKTFACPYKDFETCISEIGKELPPELKPFIEKQCEALGCRIPLSPLSDLAKTKDNNASNHRKKKSSKAEKITCNNKLSS